MDDLLVSVNDIHIGDRIRRSIKSNDITRGHFAELLGVSESKVDRILQNRTIETSLLYDKAHQDLCLDRCGLDEIRIIIYYF